MNKYPLPLCEVVWHDAVTTYGWEENDEADTNEELVTTIGFVVARGEHTVIVSSTIDKEHGTQNNSRIKIPTGMIKTIKELSVSYKKVKEKKDESRSSNSAS